MSQDRDNTIFCLQRAIAETANALRDFVTYDKSVSAVAHIENAIHELEEAKRNILTTRLVQREVND